MDSRLDVLGSAVYDDPTDSAVCYTYLLETGLYNDAVLKNTPVSVICRTAYLVLFTLGYKDMDAMACKFNELGI